MDGLFNFPGGTATTMLVRPSRPADRDFVVSLAGRFAEFELPSWLTRELVTDGTASQLEKAISDTSERSSIFIAEVEGEPAGFVWVHLVPDFYGGPDLAKISEIAVTKDGLGIGSRLIEAAETWAVARGCDRTILNVMEHNYRARAFYERLGFAPEYTMLVKPLALHGKKLLGG